MTVRLATPDDAPATARVQVESWLTTYKGIVSDQYLQSLVDRLPGRQRRHHDNIKAGKSIQIVGCNDAGTVVAWLSAGQARDDQLIALGYSAEIYALYLIQRAQRQGLGRAMMCEAFNRLTHQGFTRAYVCVLRDNLPAVAFYRRVGGLLLFEKNLELGGRSHSELVLGIDDLASRR